MIPKSNTLCAVDIRPLPLVLAQIRDVLLDFVDKVADGSRPRLVRCVVVRAGPKTPRSSAAETTGGCLGFASSLVGGNILHNVLDLDDLGYRDSDHLGHSYIFRLS